MRRRVFPVPIPYPYPYPMWTFQVCMAAPPVWAAGFMPTSKATTA